MHFGWIYSILPYLMFLRCCSPPIFGANGIFRECSLKHVPHKTSAAEHQLSSQHTQTHLMDNRGDSCHITTTKTTPYIVHSEHFV